MTSKTTHLKGEYCDGNFWYDCADSLVTIGVTAQAIEEIGVVQSIEFPDEGEDFEKGDVVCTIEGAKGTLEVLAPANGFVQENNEDLAVNEEFDLVSDDPADEGWLMTLQIEDEAELTGSESSSSGAAAANDEDDDEDRDDDDDFDDDDIDFEDEDLDEDDDEDEDDEDEDEEDDDDDWDDDEELDNDDEDEEEKPKRGKSGGSKRK